LSLLWELLWVLSANSKRQKAVDPDCLTGPSSGRAIVHRRQRLGRLLPSELAAKIRVAGRRTYRLDLEPKDIEIFQVEEAERVVRMEADVLRS
jgi:hypothetical protein